MIKIATLVSFLLFFPEAHGADLINMAHKAGFNSCDDAITTEFKALSDNGNGVASTGYFNSRSFSVMATWGTEKDSVWKNTTFIKFGRRCLAYSLVGSTYPANCETFEQANTEWEVIKEVADFTWTQNNGGVNALLKDLPNGHCSITYRVHQSYDIDSRTAIQNAKHNIKKKDL